MFPQLKESRVVVDMRKWLKIDLQKLSKSKIIRLNNSHIAEEDFKFIQFRKTKI